MFQMGSIDCCVDRVTVSTLLAVVVEVVVVILVQGKGMRKTFWLIGKDGFGKPLPLPPEESG